MTARIQRGSADDIVNNQGAKHAVQMVFVHGWGQSASAWFQQAGAFPQAQCIPLPGHGGAADLPSEQWLDALAARLPQAPCILIGWSLGGMLAMQLAHKFPERVRALVLVSSTPCFVKRPDWQPGCTEAVFSAFQEGVAAPDKEMQRSLGRFFALMLHGDALSRSAFSQLARQAVDRQHPASRTGLEQGLKLLATLDLRPIIEDLQMPGLIIHGEQDAIVPMAAGQVLAQHMPQAEWHAISQCGHAPFLTQSEKFNDILEAWCRAL